jgi:ankyrin repeat protein
MPETRHIAWPRLACASALFLLALGLCLAAQPSVASLFKAVEADNKEWLRALLRTDPSQVNQAYLGRTPMHLAALNHHLQQMTDMVGAGADVNIADSQGATPLHLAVLSRSLRATRILLALGARPQDRDRRGNTPLHVAAWVGASPQVWRALLEAGADPQARDGRGRTPADILERLYPPLAAQIRQLPAAPHATAPSQG